MPHEYAASKLLHKVDGASRHAAYLARELNRRPYSARSTCS